MEYRIGGINVRSKQGSRQAMVLKAMAADDVQPFWSKLFLSQHTVMSAFQPQEPREGVSAETLAQHLFTFFVIGDESTLFLHVRDRCEASPTFLPEVFGFQLFVYLVASITIVLTNEYSRQPNSVKVIVSLKRLVHDEVVRRGTYSTDEVDDAIEEAASKLHDLLYTDPEAKPGYCFDWSQEWLKACGVEEYNPAVLFEFAHKWNTQNVALAKMVNEMRIVEL